MSGTLLHIATRTAKGAPMIELESATVDLQTGVADDVRGKRGKRQVTIISSERWNEARELVGQDLPWTTRRANLMVAGIDFDNLWGKQLRIGEVLLVVNEECHPCGRMDEAYKGLRKAMTPRVRGGILCTVVDPGTISKGDVVSVES